LVISSFCNSARLSQHQFQLPLVSTPPSLPIPILRELAAEREKTLSGSLRIAIFFRMPSAARKQARAVSGAKPDPPGAEAAELSGFWLLFS